MIGLPVERCATSLSVTAPTPPSTSPALAMDSAACALHIRKPIANREPLNAQLLVAVEDEVHIHKPIANRETLNARMHVHSCGS